MESLLLYEGNGKSRIAVVLWLSLLHNFIQLRLQSGSAQVQTLLTSCWRFAMLRISDKSGNKGKRFSLVDHNNSSSSSPSSPKIQ